MLKSAMLMKYLQSAHPTSCEKKYLAGTVELRYYYHARKQWGQCYCVSLLVEDLDVLYLCKHC